MLFADEQTATFSKHAASQHVYESFVQITVPELDHVRHGFVRVGRHEAQQGHDIHLRELELDRRDSVFIFGLFFLLWR